MFDENFYADLEREEEREQTVLGHTTRQREDWENSFAFQFEPSLQADDKIPY